MRLSRATLALLLAAAAGAHPADKVRFVPQVAAGQTLVYLVSYASQKNTKTESRVALPGLPTDAKLEVHGLLLVDVLGKNTDGGLRLRTQFAELAPGPKRPGPGGPDQGGGPQPAGKNAVQFTLMPDGSTPDPGGIDELLPEEREAWRAWLASFARAMSFPKGGVRRGDKWDREEPETSPAPIAQLFWNQKTEYVRDEPCDGIALSATGEELGPASKKDTCGVVLTAAKLVQKSSQKDATPEGFKLHQLKTRGSAGGSNETISFFSKTTGLLVRSTDDAVQTMDVLVLRADGGNQVHYSVSARSHIRIALVTDSALAKP